MVKFQVKPKEAQILEGIEQRENRRRRTEKALFAPNVPPHKREKYRKKFLGKFTKDRFNDNQLREKTVKKVYGYNKDAKVSDAMIRD